MCVFMLWCQAKLGWAPSVPIRVGVLTTYLWIKEQVEAEQRKSGGEDVSSFASSVVVVQVTDTLDSLNLSAAASK